MLVKSWWPLHSTWESGGENYGHWTEWNEHLYQKRLKEIQEGAQPLPAHKWRDQLRGPKEARQVKKSVSTFSQDFLHSHQQL
jgi:hypothetical protein